MNEAEKNIIAALLKSVRSSELIPEATYQSARKKLYCAFDACAPMDHDGTTKKKGGAQHGYSQSEG